MVLSSSASEVDVSESVMLVFVLLVDCGGVVWRVSFGPSMVLLVVGTIACVVLGLLVAEVPEVLGLLLVYCRLGVFLFPPSVESMLFLICIDVVYSSLELSDLCVSLGCLCL